MPIQIRKINNNFTSTPTHMNPKRTQASVFSLKRMSVPVAVVSIILTFSSCTPKKQETTAKQAESASVTLKLQSASQYITAKNTDLRLSKGEELVFQEFLTPSEHEATIMIDPKKTFQTIEGIGGALTDASAETFYKLPADKQAEILKAYYNPIEGIGYSLGRTNINSCDFSSGSYSYAEAGDTELKNFSIEHDLKFKIPFIKAAIKETGDNLKLYASPWSPPAWMKSNNNMLKGGKLLPEYYQVWANYYVRFVQEYGKLGINFWGLTVQNEPAAVQTWESCIYTAEEERDFVKNFMGPTLEKAGMSGLKLMIWDHNRGLMYQRAKTVFEDPEASKYVWGTGFHWYTGDHFDNVRLVAEAFPDKKLVFTEGCAFPFNYDSLLNYKWGEVYGKSVLMDISNGACGWTDWNILLDETGGPNHVGNFCLAPVIGNTKTGEVIYMDSYYYLGHFSKFFRPGSKRITCSSNSDDLLSTAVLNPDGGVAVVVLNLGEKDINYKVWIEGRAVTAKSLKHSIVTVIIN
jgi:glucosylceramidase